MSADSFPTSLIEVNQLRDMGVSAAEFYARLDAYAEDMELRAARTRDMQNWMLGQFGEGILPAPKCKPPKTKAKKADLDQHNDDAHGDLSEQLPEALDKFLSQGPEKHGEGWHDPGAGVREAAE